MATKAFLDGPRPRAFAHRGAHDGRSVVENTMEAFAAAVELGYRYVETDVHATADGVPVAFHDDRLDRVTDREGLISELPWREVARARVGAGSSVPRLDDLLGTWPELRVNLDPKADHAVGPLIDALRRVGAVERVCIGAFSDRRIDRVRRALGPALCTGMGPREVARLRGASVGLPIGRFRGDCAQVPVRQGPVPIVDRRFVEAAHRHGVEVHVWTIDDPSEMAGLLDDGVDGIMTDEAGLLRDVLRDRDAWPTP